MLSRPFELVLVLASSLWLPQIALNCHFRLPQRAFCLSFVVVSTAVRVATLSYFFFYTGNSLRVQTQPVLAGILIAWMVVQVVLLLLQDHAKGGPRAILPLWAAKSLFPPAYVYERAVDLDVPCDDECAICMNLLSEPVDDETAPLRSGGGGGAAIMEAGHTALYFHTPCGHKFHPECLVTWMNVKLECPTCRGSLPAL